MSVTQNAACNCEIELILTYLGYSTCLVSHLKSAHFHELCPARFTSSLKLLFSPGHGMGAPLSSYPEVALYTFHRQTDRQTD